MIQNLQHKTKIDSTQPFHIYYDIEMINNDQQNGEETPRLVYNESRNSPFITCPDNYFVSIIRFSLQTPSLPVFIPQVEVGQPNINKTIYNMYGIRNSTPGTVFTQNVTYFPTDLMVTQPNPPTVFQDLTNEYYFIYTIQRFIVLVNDSLVALNVLLGFPSAPFFYFDVTTSLLSYYCPDTFLAKLYFNQQLQTLFDTFNYYRVFIPTVTSPVYEITHRGFGGLDKITLNAVIYTIGKQESTTIGLFNPIKSIVFSTGLFPIIPELTSPPKVFGADSDLFSNGNNSNIAPILTDFEVNMSNGNTYKDTIVYAPQGEYRLIDMYGQSPISTLEVSVFWKDQFGGLHPFRLNSGCSCNLKIMFRRKDYNSINLNL